MTTNILIVDDETDIRNLMTGILEDEGYRVRQAGSDKTAYEEISSSVPDLVILDIWLQGSTDDGIDILKNIKSQYPHLPVLMISGHGTIETAVNAIKEGAYDFIEKPFKSDRLLLMIARALEIAALKRENENLRVKAEGPTELVGHSVCITAVKQALERVAHTNSRVLLSGEPGTGKDVAARYIHRHSNRVNAPFMILNCATLRPERLEMELFGVEDGTGITHGVLEKANGGTIFLDEVADMPLETQGKIVRVLQDHKVLRLGGRQPIDVDVRIIASSNRDLQILIEKGDFREDLYYRLNVVPIEMPPLKNRLQDIEILSNYFASVYGSQAGLPEKQFSKGCITALQSYEWPGNVRQLRNVIERLLIMSSGDSDVIQAEHLPQEIRGISPSKMDDSGIDYSEMVLREAREVFEKEYLALQIRRFGGNISQTAQFIGMERSALHRKMKQLGLNLLSGHNGSDVGGALTDAANQNDNSVKKA